LRNCLAEVATPELAEDVMLVAGELVANALEHGRPPVVLHAVSQQPHLVVVEVIDGGPPMELAPAPSAVGAVRGRGLAIVQALADEWGVRGTGRGKSVWARVSAPADEISMTTNER
jgi:anti-sigma regulatory factor (Ser/Thr protein kinase)